MRQTARIRSKNARTADYDAIASQACTRRLWLGAFSPPLLGICCLMIGGFWLMMAIAPRPRMKLRGL